MSGRLTVLSAAGLVVSAAACGQSDSGGGGGGGDQPRFHAVQIGAAIAQEAPESREKFAKIENAPKQFLVKSGLIEYELSGVRSGTETLYWDDWGMLQARRTTATMGVKGFAQSENTWTITRPDGVFLVDLDANSAVKTADKGAPSLFAVGADNMERLRGIGAAAVGAEKVAGKTCDVWEIGSAASETCLWMNLPLKVTTNAVGMSMNALAVRVEAGAAVDRSVFDIPAGVTITDAAFSKDRLNAFESVDDASGEAVSKTDNYAGR